jgi:hypothetical protein
MHGSFKLLKKVKKGRRHYVQNGCFKLLKTQTPWLGWRVKKKLFARQAKYYVDVRLLVRQITKKAFSIRWVNSDVDMSGCYGQWQLTRWRLSLAMDNGGDDLH